MKELIIDRNTWYRGRSSFSSKLLRHDGQKCCLGFLCLDNGFDEEEILDYAYVLGIKYKKPIENYTILQYLINYESIMLQSSTFANLATTINDVRIGENIENLYTYKKIYKIDSEEQREQLLTELFATIDFQLKFIN